MKNKMLAALALGVFLSACTTMPDQRVAELPPLKVTEHVLEPGEIFSHCRSVMSWWHWAALAFPIACATISFEQGTCDIYVATNSAPDTVEHERRHCQGYDHGSRLAEAYKRWLAAQPAPVEELPVPAAIDLANTRLSQSLRAAPIPSVP